MNPVPILIVFDSHTGTAIIEWNDRSITKCNTNKNTIENIHEKYKPIIQYN